MLRSCTKSPVSDRLLVSSHKRSLLQLATLNLLAFAKAHASIFFILSLMFPVTSGLMAQTFSEVSMKDALDSLRSPEQSNFIAQLPPRESIATTVSELDDIVLNDDDLSSSSLAPVLSTPELDPVGPLRLQEEIEVDDGNGLHDHNRPINSEMNPVDRDSPPLGKSHRRTASVATIRSGRTSSFVEEENISFRISLDVQNALQEEFSRLQKEKKALQEQGAEESIDWGMFTSRYMVSSANFGFPRLLGGCHIQYALSR